MSSLALGTVQFGLNYGIKNSRGKIPEAEIRQLLAVAAGAGIDTLDTAAAYGESEVVLGRVLLDPAQFRVITKLPVDSQQSVRSEVEASLRRLQRQSVDGYILHNFETWQKNPRVLDDLRSCQQDGLVEKIGVSLYHPAEAEALISQNAPLDLVQVPYSLIDRRFERVLPRLVEYGTEVHVRSVFLQGLLFMSLNELQPRFASMRDALAKLHRLAKESGLGVAALGLGYVAANPCVSRVVIGVDGLQDLESNIDAFSKRALAAAALSELEDISTLNEDIILPYKWVKP